MDTAGVLDKPLGQLLAEDRHARLAAQAADAKAKEKVAIAAELRAKRGEETTCVVLALRTPESQDHVLVMQILPQFVMDLFEAADDLQGLLRARSLDAVASLSSLPARTVWVRTHEVNTTIPRDADGRTAGWSYALGSVPVALFDGWYNKEPRLYAAMHVTPRELKFRYDGKTSCSICRDQFMRSGGKLGYA